MTDAPSDLVRFFGDTGRRVLTFLGYSNAGYEDPEAMLERARQVLAICDPERTLVNAGATEAGIGAVYPLAKERGFLTTGIVSSRAKEEGVPLSPSVDRVFFVPDERWGGLIPGTDRLSPTSAAMVDVSDELVAIGGGGIARDEMLAAARAGKEVRFYPADLSHRHAIDSARQAGRPPPTDFSGALARAWPGGPEERSGTT